MLTRRQLGKADKVQETIESMRAAHIQPTDITRNAVIDGAYSHETAATLLNLLDGRPARKPAELFELMVRLTSPDRTRDSWLMRTRQAASYAQRGRLDAFDALCAATQLAPSRTLIQYVIVACTQRKLLARATSELVRLRQLGGWLSVEAVSELIVALAKTGRLTDADALLFESRARQVKPASTAHASLVYGWSQAKEFARAERVLAEMRRDGPAPTAEAWKPLIYGYAEANQPQKADAALQAMQQSGLALDTRAAKAVLESWLRAGDTERAAAVLRATEGAGNPPDPLSLFALAKAEMKAGRREAGAAIFARMKSLGMAVPSLDA